MGEEGHTEYELSDDPYDCQRLDVQNVPIIITVSKIGHCHVVDTSMQEETCVLARLVKSYSDFFLKHKKKTN